MSKEPGSKGRLDTGDDAAARRRRRRRGSALRVPSDDVPRGTDDGGHGLGGSPMPPEPESPDLAVSVAAAFGDEAEGDEGSEELAEGPAEQTGGGGSGPADGDGAAGSAGGADDDGAQPEEDHATEVRSSEPELGEPDSTAAAEVAGPHAQSGDGDDPPDAVPEPTNDSDSGDVDAQVPVEVARDGSGDAEGDVAESAPAPTVPRKMPRASTEALSEEELEELMEPIEDEDEDEEEAVPVAASPGAPAEERTSAGGSASFAVPEVEEDEDDFDAEETSQFVPVVIDDTPADEEEEPAADRAREAGPSSGGRAGVAVLERRTLEPDSRRARARSADGASDAAEPNPNDSGEILSDELVEEIEDAGAAPAPGKPYSFDASGPVEVEGGRAPGGGEVATEAREVSNGESAARPPDPPPVPSGSPAATPKPPRAPSVSEGAKSPHGKAWFDEIFDEDYLRTLPFLTPQATQAEAKFVADAIAAGPGAQVLDVGCGYGRHAMELAARGYHLVGLDSALPLLLRGADEAQRRGLTIHFIHGDMRELTFDSQFDAAYCLFSTFGYFDDETNKKTAENIARALKPGGRFVVEVLNRDYLIQDLPNRVWWEGDGCVVLEEVDFNYFSSRIVSNRSVLFDDGRQLDQEISIRAYSLHELGKLLQAAGFRVLEVSGSMHTRGRFFGAQARDIIVLAEKRGAGDS